MSTLYVVATPIGNLEDITLRAIRTLKECGAILAEDTRHSLGLLQHLGVPKKPLHAYHDHNEAEMVPRALRWLAEGTTLALITDAGTPAISDPGYRLVRAARDAGFQVVPIPGACAAVAALSAGGLPTDRFTFAGFPPKKAGALGRFFEELAGSPGTLVLYAAARDVVEVLEAAVTARGDTDVAIFRELTKTFEEVSRGKASAVIADWTATPRKGEVTLLLAEPEAPDWDDDTLRAMLDKGSLDDVRAATGVSKKRLYSLKLGR
jgi:16S rRNA (cytidine1402-2'-O)-methyltransferase